VTMTHDALAPVGCTQAVVGTYELFDLSLNGFGQQFACTTAQLSGDTTN
jgi:hypothetical protein